ncbi:MAG: DNA polymerase IV [Epsilonproteobacteria bacterium]|nr:DNA polymerase IV [Campylobacterota bacterium]
MLHIDIDCFFASAHRINNPKLYDIPIAVGGRSNLNIFDRKKQTRKISAIEGAFTSSILSSNDNMTSDEYFKDPDGRYRGIITTASYEARKFGVKTAMSVAEALMYCPHLTLIPPDYQLYHELSHKLKLLLEKEIPSIEQFSIDEFFCDVSGWIKDEEIIKFAMKLKLQIASQIGLPVSIGIAKTKWIAKLATEDAKPFGIKLVLPDEVENYIKDIPIHKFPGIGDGYRERLKGRGVKTLGDIKEKKELFYSWGKNGIQLYNRINGIDNEKLQISSSKKSIGLGRTFDNEDNRDEIKRKITILARHITFLAIKGKHSPLTYTLQIRYKYGEKSHDYINTNRLFNEQYFKQELLKLFSKIDIHPSQYIIQINITISNFSETKYNTLDLFHYEEDVVKSKLTQSMQKLRDKFGIDIIKSGGEL